MLGKPTKVKEMIPRIVILGILLATTALTGCRRVDGNNAPPDLSNRKARIVTTTGMIADIAQEIGGDKVEVTSLIGAGGDPHKYYPSAGDMDKIDGADLILTNGLHLEAKMGDVLEGLKKKNKRTVTVTENIDKCLLREADGEHDPHVWFDVKLWMQAVIRVREALVSLDEKNKAHYEERAQNYLNQLEQLDAEVRALAAKVPVSKRVMITAHDAFGYFGRAYGFEVRGLQGTSTNNQAGTKARQDLADVIAKRGIPVIFGETSVEDHGIDSVIETARRSYPGVKIERSEARLFSDAMGEPGTPEGSYIGMVRHNIKTIVAELSR
jgi:manganese/zinc/iron transport system substrate-binding protein